MALRPTFELIVDEPVVIVEATGNVDLFALSLGIGTRLVFHKKSMPYHQHDKEIDVIVSGGASVGVSAPSLPQEVHAAIAQGFAGAEISAGRKVAFIFHDRVPYKFHRLEGGTENLSLVGLTGGVRSLVARQSKFAYWNQSRRELTIYEGTGGKVTTPPSHHIQSWSRRFEGQAIALLLKLFTESASFAFLDGVQQTYRVGLPR